MKISWLGHSCFRIEDSQGKVIVTDPFDETVGYEVPHVKADVVTVSHDHFDHNNVKAIKGDPVVVKGPGNQVAAGIEFAGTATYHDEEGGKLRGPNTIFCFRMDDLNVCHLGDLGHTLSEKLVEFLGEVDVMMVPVGGVFTIDSKGAKKVIEQVKPRLVIPMHFKTKALKFDIEGVDPFLEGLKAEHPGHEVVLFREDLPSEGVRVMVLDYK